MRLLCLPYAGAGPSIFNSWRGAFGDDVEVRGVGLPGREQRLKEPPLTTLAPLIEVLANDMQACLDEPFALFGHSMGALIAFELARHIRRDYGQLPVHLFVSAHAAPHLQRAGRVVHQLSDAALVEALRELNGTPEAVLTDAELLTLVLPIVRADFAVCETYMYESDVPLTCPISVFGGIYDAAVNRAALGAWQQHTRGQVSVRLFPGDHFFLASARELVLHAIYDDLLAHSFQTRQRS